MKIRSPKTPLEWEKYYDLRYRILRKPWGQPVGSERNEGDKTGQHFALWKKGNLLAVVRMDEGCKKGTVQIRFMAVEFNQQGRGVGKIMMLEVEKIAKVQNKRLVTLHARESAVDFYKKIGYSIVEKSYLLFDTIQHYLMEKRI